MQTQIFIFFERILVNIINKKIAFCLLHNDTRCIYIEMIIRNLCFIFLVKRFFLSLKQGGRYRIREHVDGIKWNNVYCFCARSVLLWKKKHTQKIYQNNFS